MREMGLQGVVRGRRTETTKPALEEPRPADLVERNFNASRPNELWVSDLTYVASWRGLSGRSRVRAGTRQYSEPSV